MGVNQDATPTKRAGRGGNFPPEQYKWKKGCAPRSPGRPSIKRFSDAAKAALAEVDPKTGKSGAETLVELAFRRAKQGSVKQLTILLAYAEGRPAQNVKLTGGVLHAWRPLAELTNEEMAELVARRLKAPEEEKQDNKQALEIEAEAVT